MGRIKTFRVKQLKTFKYGKRFYDVAWDGENKFIVSDPDTSHEIEITKLYNSFQLKNHNTKWGIFKRALESACRELEDLYKQKKEVYDFFR